MFQLNYLLEGTVNEISVNAINKVELFEPQNDAAAAFFPDTERSEIQSNIQDGHLNSTSITDWNQTEPTLVCLFRYILIVYFRKNII